MPEFDDLELPIEPLKLKGPGVDALENWKEDNNNERVSAEALRQNFNDVRNETVSNLKSLLQNLSAAAGR